MRKGLATIFAIISLAIALAIPAQASAATVVHWGQAHYQRCGNYQSSSFRVRADAPGNHTFYHELRLPNGQVVIGDTYGPHYLYTGQEFERLNVSIYVPWTQGGTGYYRLEVRRDGGRENINSNPGRVC